MPSLTAKLDKLYSVSPVLPFNNSSRIVIMSDCHRGQGNGADNFLPNSMIFQGALEYYWQNGYTYIELGDGDELWENRCIGVILRTYTAPPAIFMPATLRKRRKISSGMPESRKA